MEMLKAIAEMFGWRESEADKCERSELERKIGEGIFSSYSEKSISIARKIGNLEGLLRWLSVKNFNCAYSLSHDEMEAVGFVVRNAIECRTVKKEKDDEKINH